LLTVLFWPAAFVRLALDLGGGPFPGRFLQEADPWKEFVYFFGMPAIYLTTAAGVAYVFWGGLSLIGAASAMLWRRPSCPICGDPAHRGFAIGCSCDSCGSPLAPWTQIAAAVDPGAALPLRVPSP
jgi:hypothetical protein